MRRLRHVACCGDFAFRIDDHRLLLALGFGNLGNRALEGIWEHDVFKLHGLDVNSPGIGRRIDRLLDALGNLFLVAEELVERHFAHGVAHGGLRQLRDGEEKVLYLNHRLGRIQNLVVDHGVDTYGDVVFGDRLLVGHVHRLYADVHFDHALEDRDEYLPPRLPCCGVLSHREDDASFVLVHLPDEREDEDDGRNDVNPIHGHGHACVGNGENDYSRCSLPGLGMGFKYAQMYLGPNPNPKRVVSLEDIGSVLDGRRHFQADLLPLLSGFQGLVVDLDRFHRLTEELLSLAREMDDITDLERGFELDDGNADAIVEVRNRADGFELNGGCGGHRGRGRKQLVILPSPRLTWFERHCDIFLNMVQYMQETPIWRPFYIL